MTVFLTNAAFLENRMVYCIKGFQNVPINGYHNFTCVDCLGHLFNNYSGGKKNPGLLLFYQKKNKRE